MGFSSLIVGRWPLGTAKPRFGPRKNLKTGQPIKIDMFIVHHAAMTRNLRGEFVDPTRELSATYGMAQNGDIYGVLDESLRPFTSSTWLADTRAITIEIENLTGDPEWRISDRAFDQLARLIADVATRHEFPIDRDHVIGHKEVLPRFGAGKNTICPGPWLFSRMDALVALARKYQAEAATPTAEPEMEDDMFTDNDRYLLGLVAAAMSRVELGSVKLQAELRELGAKVDEHDDNAESPQD